MSRSFHIALTGHRPDRLDGYDLTKPYYARMRYDLTGLVLDYLCEHGHVTLHSGLALGADTVWSRVALETREGHPGHVALVAHVPFPDQAGRWPTRADRDFWQVQCDQADQVLVHARAYSPQALHLRSQAMVRASDLVLAVYDGSPRGGTAASVTYARRLNKPVRIAHPDAWRATP